LNSVRYLNYLIYTLDDATKLIIQNAHHNNNKKVSDQTPSRASVTEQLI